jgi:hypothetical protein
MALIIGTSNDDVLLANTGENDILDGGAGSDTASFENSIGIIVNLSSGLAIDPVSGDFDTLISIENVKGSAFNDGLFGNDLANVLEGGGGDDFLSGAGGTDAASYANASSGSVIVDLGAGIAFDDGNGGSDILTGIENVAGSAFSDFLTGDGGSNELVGGGGDDVLSGRAGGDVFGYDFDFTAGSGGETFSFTTYFAEHGGSVFNGEVADGTKQGQFSSLYTQWLEMLASDHGLGTVIDIGQNSGENGIPLVENMTGSFGERESFTWTSGSGKKEVTHERWYSDTWSSGEGGEGSVTSADGLDTILDFTWGEDKLSFGGITHDQFLDLFKVDSSQDVTGDAVADTVISTDGSDDWSITLSGVSGHDLLAFANDSIIFA